jgi:hypothetical protein
MGVSSDSGLESSSIADDLRIEVGTPCGPAASGLKEESSGDTISPNEPTCSSSVGLLSVKANSRMSDLLSVPIPFLHDEHCATG